MPSEKESTAAQLRGRVAQILTSREVAINLGEDDGVKLGMYFDILHEQGQDVKDPVTGEILGNIERPKVRVKVTRVQDRLSLAATYKKKKVNEGGQLQDYSVFSRSLMPSRWVTKYETLKTEDKTWENLEEKDSYVKIGDAVVQVLPSLDDDDIDHVEPINQPARTV